MADIRNSSYSKIGEVDSNGTIRNSSYTKVGEVNGSTWRERACGAALLLLPL